MLLDYRADAMSQRRTDPSRRSNGSVPAQTPEGVPARFDEEGYMIKRRGSRISCAFEMLVRNILLSKGKISVPWQISMRIRGKRKASEIIPVMQILADEGLGSLVHLVSGGNYNGKPRQVFIKKAADEVAEGLVKYCISLKEYNERYSIHVKEHEKTYRAAISHLSQNRGRGNPEAGCIVLE